LSESAREKLDRLEAEHRVRVKRKPKADSAPSYRENIGLDLVGPDTTPGPPMFIFPEPEPEDPVLTPVEADWDMGAPAGDEEEEDPDLVAGGRMRVEASAPRRGMIRVRMG
jgi:hypothetical protein